jgi:chemotaxis protein MotB
MAKKKKHAEHENLERWLISYADFITLLFAVFVALWALKRDNPPSKSVTDGIKRAFNVFGEKTAAQEAKVAVSPVGGSQAIFTVEPMYQSIVESMKKSGIKGVSVHKVDRGVIIRIPDEALFEPGKAEVRNSYKDTLNRTAAILKDMPNQIQIEGHTDDVPIKTAAYPSNWELSTARAIALMRHFTEESGLPPEKFAIAGYSKYQPIAGNDSPEGRSKNRRVDIVVIKEKNKNQNVMSPPPPGGSLPITPAPAPTTQATLPSEPAAHSPPAEPSAGQSPTGKLPGGGSIIEPIKLH